VSPDGRRFARIFCIDLKTHFADLRLSLSIQKIAYPK